MTDNGGLVLELATGATVANAISGSGTLSQSGPMEGGTVILTGSNSYTGTTTVNSSNTL